MCTIHNGQDDGAINLTIHMETVWYKLSLLFFNGKVISAHACALKPHGIDGYQSSSLRGRHSQARRMAPSHKAS